MIANEEKAVILEEKYRSLLNDIPVAAKKEYQTVFDISGYPHYENVISNWYAFFLDADNDHGFRDLFYKSLRELLGQAPSGPCKVEREYVTNNGRIDLLVHEGANDDMNRFSNPVIIENKIYAEIYNDLGDYWSSVRSEDDRKYGLVLCIKHTSQDESEVEKANCGIKGGSFIVHTHQEYMNIVRRNLSDYIVNSKLQYMNLLQDFMANIERMSRMNVMDDSSKYYFNHHEKIDALMRIKTEANRTVINNAYEVIQSRDDLKWGTSRSMDGTFSVAIDGTGATCYVTIMGLSYSIGLWMNKELSQKWNDLSEQSKEIICLQLSETGGKREIDNSKETLAKLHYQVDVDDVDDYHEIIIGKISNDWVRALSNL